MKRCDNVGKVDGAVAEMVDAASANVAEEAVECAAVEDEEGLNEVAMTRMAVRRTRGRLGGHRMTCCLQKGLRCERRSLSGPGPESNAGSHCQTLR